MSIHFPKNPFSSFGNPFSSKPKSPNGPSDAPRPAPSSWSGRTADLPPRRTASPAGTSASAARTDRRGPVPSHPFRPGAAPPAPQAAPKLSAAAKLLGNFQIAELDAMSDAQLRQVVDFLGAPPGATLASAPLAANWQRLRREFNEADVRKLILGDAKQVVSFLLEPARPQQRRPRPEPQRPQTARPSQAPSAASSIPAQGARPALRPISILGMDRQAALQALAARGMKPQQLEEMKEDFFRHVQHGNSSSGAALSEKYKAFVSDDFTSSAVYASYAKLLGRLSANGSR